MVQAACCHLVSHCNDVFSKAELFINLLYRFRFRKPKMFGLLTFYFFFSMTCHQLLDSSVFSMTDILFFVITKLFLKRVGGNSWKQRVAAMFLIYETFTTPQGGVLRIEANSL